MLRTVRRIALVLMAAVLGAPAAGVMAGPASQPPTARSMVIDTDEMLQDCTEFVPESIHVAGITDHGKDVSLDVLVLIDFARGAEIALMRREAAELEDEELAAQAEALFAAEVDRARGLIDKATTSYSPLKVDLNWAEFDLLAPLDANGNPRVRTDNAQTIINLAKAQNGGRRPEGIDIVYVLTDKNIQLPGLGSAVAGLADCIGGVRYPDRAYAVGEIFPSIPIGPVIFYYEATAKIAGHEIGHLMGAHHHYQNCAEGIPTELVEAREPSPCTLMSNFVDFVSLNFGQLEAVVVRGHAVDFADD
ncbi:MAG: zinc-dependent metalloprotease [Actinomycetota bacterium]|nr:zinc-dependent metalloprotease [Actinomycetota bacterium]